MKTLNYNKIKKYRVCIVVVVTYDQFAIEIEAESREEAKKNAMEIFIKEKPIWSAHCKVISCSRIATY